MKLTDWFPPQVKPARKGYYHFKRWQDHESPMLSRLRMAFWDGRDWRFRQGGEIANSCNQGWRGLAEKPL